MPSESEPPQSAAETIGGNGAEGLPMEQSPVRNHGGPSPKTPRTRGNSSAVARNQRAVSATADYMAVGAVESEPVSGAIFLMYRENTGKFTDLGPRGRGETPDSSRFSDPSERFP